MENTNDKLIQKVTGAIKIVGGISMGIAGFALATGKIAIAGLFRIPPSHGGGHAIAEKGAKLIEKGWDELTS